MADNKFQYCLFRTLWECLLRVLVGGKSSLMWEEQKSQTKPKQGLNTTLQQTLCNKWSIHLVIISVFGFLVNSRHDAELTVVLGRDASSRRRLHPDSAQSLAKVRPLPHWITPIISAYKNSTTEYSASYGLPTTREGATSPSLRTTLLHVPSRRKNRSNTKLVLSSTGSALALLLNFKVCIQDEPGANTEDITNEKLPLYFYQTGLALVLRSERVQPTWSSFPRQTLCR